MSDNFVIIILYDSSICPFKRTVCLHYIIAVWIYNHSYCLIDIDHLRSYGKLGKGHTDYDQSGMFRDKSLNFLFALNISVQIKYLLRK